MANPDFGHEFVKPVTQVERSFLNRPVNVALDHQRILDEAERMNLETLTSLQVIKRPDPTQSQEESSVAKPIDFSTLEGIAEGHRRLGVGLNGQKI